MKNIFGYCQSKPKEIEEELDASLNVGIDNYLVKERQARYGKNQLEENELRWEKILFRQFRSSFIYLLLFASILSFILGEYTDGSLILVFIIINTMLGFFQEFKSEKTAKLLEKYTITKVSVIRAGQRNIINAEDLVVGDLVLLKSGDILAADVRLVEANNIMCDESTLTGESNPVEKTANIIDEKIKDIFEAKNLAFSGTSITSGSGKGIVIAIGKSSQIGQIAKLTEQTEKVSGFEVGINNFSNFILKLVVSTLTLILIANLLIKGEGANFVELLIFSIALAVSVIPEALPVVTTFSMSKGAMALAKNKVIVKRLSGIEDMGGVEVLCCDKTGTLTENSLTVDEVNSNKENIIQIASYNICQSLNQTLADPFDYALKQKLQQNEINKLSDCSVIFELPFDPIRRRSSCLVADKKENILMVKGAAEEIIKSCSNLDENEKAQKTQWAMAKNKEGRRVLAIAIKTLDGKIEKYDENFEIKNIKFVGLISFVDPIKNSAKQAIAQAKKLNVQVKIITGDAAEVAGAVAEKIGLINSSELVITGEQLEKLTKREFQEKVFEYSVFARINPEQKYQIILALRRKYQVGFLGEGINDAPALKESNVGLVVDGASDIAREAADIVLLQKDLGVVINGIVIGRGIFANVIKYIKITLASNFGNFYSVAISSLIIKFLPMLPIQILLLNLVSDFPMITVSTDNIDEDEVASPKNYNIKDIVLVATFLGIVSSFFDFIFFAIFSKKGEGALQTYWFIESVLTELVLIYSLRTKHIFFKTKRPSIAMSVLTIFAGLFAIYIPFNKIVGQNFFHFIHPTVANIMLVLLIVSVYFFTSEIVKRIYYSTIKTNNK